MKNLLMCFGAMAAVVMLAGPAVADGCDLRWQGHRSERREEGFRFDG